MEMEQRVEGEAVDTESEMDSELDDSKVEVGDEETDDEENGKDDEDLTKLLEPFSKEQLIDIIRSLSTKNRGIIEEIQEKADQDPSHCRLFVHGLGWETTPEKLTEIFSIYGELEDCRVVYDKHTGKSKRYGFVLYKHRKSVSKALKEPVKNIGNRMMSCRLASNHQQQQRRIYVGNVDSEVSSLKLLSFFSKYGEIEAGPLGFDFKTGRFRGYAFFVYKTVEGARKALEEPIKYLNGHPLYCQIVIEDKQKFGPAQPYGQRFLGDFTPYAQGPQHVQAALAVLAAAGQNPSALSMMNPALPSFGPASISPTTSQQGVLGDFGMGNPAFQNRQSHQLNSSYEIEPSEHGPGSAKRSGYFLKKLGLFIVFVFVVLFLLAIVV